MFFIFFYLSFFSLFKRDIINNLFSSRVNDFLYNFFYNSSVTVLHFPNNAKQSSFYLYKKFYNLSFFVFSKISSIIVLHYFIFPWRFYPSEIVNLLYYYAVVTFFSKGGSTECSEIT
jgi:hypothetical protein